MATMSQGLLELTLEGRTGLCEVVLCSTVKYPPSSLKILIFKPGKALATPLSADFHVALSVKTLAEILLTTDRNERTPLADSKCRARFLWGPSICNECIPPSAKIRMCASGQGTHLLCQGEGCEGGFRGTSIP